MRPIASGLNLELLKRNIARKVQDDKPPYSLGAMHTLFLCKLFSIGIEGRHQVHIAPKEEEMKEIENTISNFIDLGLP